MHLLNPYKTVVNLNLFPQWTSTCIYATGILENRVVHEMANSPTENMKVHVKDEENRGSNWKEASRWRPPEQLTHLTLLVTRKITTFVSETYHQSWIQSSI